MPLSRRSLLAALGITLPFGLGTRLRAAEKPSTKPLTLDFLPFEDAVRRAFADLGGSLLEGETVCRRVDIGHSALVRAGIQGCHNDREFAGFAAGQLKILRTHSEPGPEVGGVRLFVTTVDVLATRAPISGAASRTLDFACLPPAPIFG